MTPSKASFSPTNPSRRLSQCSKTALARSVTCSNSVTCCVSSASVSPPSAASVVAHRRRTAERSNSGGGGAPRRVVFERVEARPDVVAVCEPSPSFAAGLRGVVAPELSRSIEGRISFFCFEAGRISSRSTGTPRDTRKSRRMRDFTQFCGWRGGGATSWDQRERGRSELKIAEESEMLSTGGGESRSLVGGRRLSRVPWRAERSSEVDLNVSKSVRGG